MDQLHGAASRSRPERRCATIPFLMGQGVWLDSEKLGWDDEVRRGAQARHAVHGLHRPGRDAEGARRRTTTARATNAQNLGLEIIGHMRKLHGRASRRRRELNYTLLATPAEGLSGRFVRMDRKKLRRDSRRDRPGVLHQQLPYSGVLPHLRLSRRSSWRRPITR